MLLDKILGENGIDFMRNNLRNDTKRKNRASKKGFKKDAQDLTLAGNVISLTGQSGNVDLTTVLQTASNTSFGIAGNTGTHTFDGPTETLTFLGTSGEMNVEVATNVISYKFANTSVTPGTYGNATTTPQFTVDAVGRITNVTNVAISGGGGSGDITSVVAGTGLSGGATSGDATLDLANTAVTPGVYGSASKTAQITVDQHGRITSHSNLNNTGRGAGTGATEQRFKLNLFKIGINSSDVLGNFPPDSIPIKPA